MVAWPGLTDFSEAVQNPSVCFRGTDLETAQVLSTPRGMPMIYSGSFACVYPVNLEGHRFAVRCFTREPRGQQSRYEQLSNYLISVLPPAFVHFEYRERGILSRGGWYPIVRMEWVEGESLSKFLDSNHSNPEALRRLAAQWRGGPTASLSGLGIAHNDLQHGNVLVQSDRAIRLVDYDGIFLPRFRDQPSPELGHKNYQHPQRSSDHYGSYIDNFPILVIYTSLLAIAADPGLWQTFFNGDNLLFTQRDYKDPESSDLFKRLKNSPDLTVARLTEKLEEFCVVPVEDVPNLEAILADIPPSSAQPAAVPSPAPQTAPSPGSYREILLSRAPAQVNTPTACPRCHEPISPGTRRCQECGTQILRPSPGGHRETRLPQAPAPDRTPTTCPRCHEPASAGTRYCLDCGATIPAPSLPRPTPPQRPPMPPTPSPRSSGSSPPQQPAGAGCLMLLVGTVASVFVVSAVCG